MCECSSIIPEVKCKSVASIVSYKLSVKNSTGSKKLPTAIIFPLAIIKSEFFKTPSFSFVQMVAFLK